MTHQNIRNALEMLLNEVFGGPANTSDTWIVTNEPNSGILGTIHSLHVDEAKYVPEGLTHSVAEHVAHLHFSIDHALAHAKGETPSGDWKSSWNAGDFDECAWQRMQRSLREAQLRLRLHVHDLQNFDHFERTCGFIASLGHAAYHLGCIRQLAALAKADRRGNPSHEPVDTLAAAL